VILIGVGSNLPSPKFGTPLQTGEAALAELRRRGITVSRQSRWYESAPVPISDQPWFVNAVAAVETDLSPEALLSLVHEIEAEFGRVRRTRDEARILDLDLLVYNDLVSQRPPVLPHPRMHQRSFVLLPLAELVPGWRHPVSGESIEQLIAALASDQIARPMRG